MLALRQFIPSALIARNFNSLAFARASGVSCTRLSPVVARSSSSPVSAMASHRFCGASSQVPNLSALKVSVECASRKRAAPRSQFNGVAAGGDAHFGRNRSCHLQIQGKWRCQQPTYKQA